MHEDQILLNRGITEHLQERREELLRGRLSPEASELVRKAGLDFSGAPFAPVLAADYLRANKFQLHRPENIRLGAEYNLYRYMHPGLDTPRREAVFDRAIKTLEAESRLRRAKINKLREQWDIKKMPGRKK